MRSISWCTTVHCGPIRPLAAPSVVPAKLFGMQVHVHDMLQPEAMGLLARIRGLDGHDIREPRCWAKSPASRALFSVSWPAPKALTGCTWPIRCVRCVAGSTGRRSASCCAIWPMPGRMAGPAGPSATMMWNAPSAAGIPWLGTEPDPAFARLLMALLLSLRGSICLYQGEELGLTEAELAESDLHDPFGIAYWPEFRGRDGSRTPMPWRRDATPGRIYHGGGIVVAGARRTSGTGGGCAGSGWVIPVACVPAIPALAARACRRCCTGHCNPLICRSRWLASSGSMLASGCRACSIYPPDRSRWTRRVVDKRPSDDAGTGLRTVCCGERRTRSVRRAVRRTRSGRGVRVDGGRVSDPVVSFWLSRTWRGNSDRVT